MDRFTETLHTWQNFYFMAGSASAGLVGLMFIATSIVIPLVKAGSKDTMQSFATPTVTYFSTVLLLACVMLIPTTTPGILAALSLIGGLSGLAINMPHVLRLLRAAREHNDFNIADWLSQILLPVASYLLITAAGVFFAANQPSLSFTALWLTTVFLLFSGIVNTWTVVIWVVGHQISEE